MKLFEQKYPYITSWVEEGWIEIGSDGYSSSKMRVLDEGGMIWESRKEYLSLDHALAAADNAIMEWCNVHIPDIDIRPKELPSYTTKQGQYLAFIYNYTQIHGRPPAEADMQRFFNVSPPTVHQMILKLAELDLVSRVPRQARSLRVLIPAHSLPILIRNP